MEAYYLLDKNENEGGVGKGLASAGCQQTTSSGSQDISSVRLQFFKKPWLSNDRSSLLS